MKSCPYCAEEIRDEAIKCRHCLSSLGARPAGLGLGTTVLFALLGGAAAALVALAFLAPSPSPTPAAPAPPAPAPPVPEPPTPARRTRSRGRT